MALLVVIVAITATGRIPSSVIMIDTPSETTVVRDSSQDRPQASVLDIVLAGSTSGFHFVGVDAESSAFVFEKEGASWSSSLEFEVSPDRESALANPSIKVKGWGEAEPVILVDGDEAGVQWSMVEDQETGLAELHIEVERELEPGAWVLIKDRSEA